MKEYPDNITWMIEVRDWPDDEEPVPTPERPEVPEWMKWVRTSPVKYGTGIVIRLEQLNLDDKPMQPPQIRNYLLTCGHVVRMGRTGIGPVAKEIICWHPEYGYVRTKNRCLEKNEGRHKHQMTGGHNARISPLSPCFGIDAATPDFSVASNKDWVLLDIEEVEGRAASFESAPSVSKVVEPKANIRTVAVGYPGGAGGVNIVGQREDGVYTLEEGKPPQAARSGKHKIREVADRMINYREVVDSRPGMSGGGVFRATDQALVGLHRSRDDAALHAQAISITHILEWLRTHRHLRPVFPREPTGGGFPLMLGTLFGGLVAIVVTKFYSPFFPYWIVGLVVAIAFAVILMRSLICLNDKSQGNDNQETADGTSWHRWAALVCFATSFAVTSLWKSSEATLLDFSVSSNVQEIRYFAQSDKRAGAMPSKTLEKLDFSREGKSLLAMWLEDKNLVDYSFRIYPDKKNDSYYKEIQGSDFKGRRTWSGAHYFEAHVELPSD